MSVQRTRLLFADNDDLLAQARNSIVSRPEFDVVTAATAADAIRLAASPPSPAAVVLPAAGGIDGIQICRSVKSTPQGQALPVLLALPAEAAAHRDACFAAGADDVLFAPVEAADIAARLDPAVAPFRTAPRADVELVIRLASPTGNAVIDAKATQISREALLVTLPAGIAPPAPHVLVRAVFTLYEGGTLQVWARVAPSAPPPRTVLRFVGLTEPERRAIDYFVDFYLRRAGAEELLRSAVTPTASGADPAASSETLRLLAEAPIEKIAGAAALLANGREPSLPPGFNVLRVRGAMPKLAPAETSALRGTTMYNTIVEDLRLAAAAKLRLFEMTAVYREGGARLDANTAEQTAIVAMTEAQQIHNGIEAALQELLKGGNTAAVRDLTPVKAGLLSACVELKAALDREVLGKNPARPAAAPRAPATPTRYDAPVKAAAAERPSRAGAREARAPASGGRKTAVVVLLVVLAAGAAWTNRGLFGVRRAQPLFHAEIIEFETNGVRIWQSAMDERTSTATYIVDGSWQKASTEQRDAAVADLVARSTGMSHVRVIEPSGRELATRDR